MIVHHPRWRRAARVAARTGVIVSAAMFAVTAWAASGIGIRPALAAEFAGNLGVATDGTGSAQQPLNSGGSATPFALVLPEGAECPGDSATDNYRVQTYMVPAAVDPGTLTFDTRGPSPQGVGTDFRQPLFDSSGNPFVNELTDVATDGGGGTISGLPTFAFAVYGQDGADGAELVPAGTYNIGIACTLDLVLERYWNVRLVFAADPTDEPAGITWTVAAEQLGPTTPSSSTTTNASTTTTAPSGGGGTTLPPTTAPADTTPETPAVLGGTATPQGSSAAGAVQSLAFTGRSSASLVVWGTLLIVFGRMAVLLGRTPAVLPARAR
jgi:hypothetical protein